MVRPLQATHQTQQRLLLDPQPLAQLAQANMPKFTSTKTTTLPAGPGGYRYPLVGTTGR